jgi:predicted MFS family arabinose efflux permease
MLMLTLTKDTPVAMLLLITLVLGVPNGFNNLGLQAALYAVTPGERISWAAGQYQTFRYVGATLASAVLGSVFRHQATTEGLHDIALVLAVITAVLVGTSALTRRNTAPRPV